MKTTVMGALVAWMTVALTGVSPDASAVPAPQVTSTPGPSTGKDTTNPLSPAYGHAYRHGVLSTRSGRQQMRAYTKLHATAPAATAPAATSTSSDPRVLSYGGGVDNRGVTTGAPKVYLVFWGTQWGTQSTDANGNLTFSNDPAGGAPRLQQMFKGLGTGNELWSGTMTQYCEGVAAGATTCPGSAPHVGYPTGGALAGAWYDSSAPEPTAPTAAQLAGEAVSAAGHFANSPDGPKSDPSNRNSQYVILSATGLNPDSYRSSNFCAWHDWSGDLGLSSSYGDIAFTNMPYVVDVGAECGQNFVNSGSAGTLDGYTMTAGHEYAETITDQNPVGGWTNHTGDVTYGGEENADECAWIAPGSPGGAANVATGNGSYPEQATWSNDTGRCELTHPVVGGSLGTPSGVSATGGRHGATVSWAPPTQTGSSSLTSYTVIASPGGASVTVPATLTSTTVTGLSAWQPYTFTVTASNADTTSDASAPSGSVTPLPMGSLFIGSSPQRALDTRTHLGAPGAIGPGQTLTLTIPGLPSNATAVVVNVTATNPTAASYLTAYPTGQNRPPTSNLNYTRGQTVPNLVTVALGPNRSINLYNNAGDVDVIADIAGYYTP